MTNSKIPLYHVSSDMTSAASLAPAHPRSRWRGETAILMYLAAGTIVIHWIAALHAAGFHRDELATLDDARHLAWGYDATRRSRRFSPASRSSSLVPRWLVFDSSPR